MCTGGKNNRPAEVASLIVGFFDLVVRADGCGAGDRTARDRFGRARPPDKPTNGFTCCNRNLLSVTLSKGSRKGAYLVFGWTTFLIGL